MKIICITFFLFLISCDRNSPNNAKKTPDTKVDTLKTTILGQWGGLGESSAVLEIRIDSIYYLEEKKAYPYTIIGKDLIIERQESKTILRNISVVEDTMTFTFNDEQGQTTYAYRFKAKSK